MGISPFIELDLIIPDCPGFSLRDTCYDCGVDVDVGRCSFFLLDSRTILMEL